MTQVKSEKCLAGLAERPVSRFWDEGFFVAIISPFRVKVWAVRCRCLSGAAGCYVREARSPRLAPAGYEGLRDADRVCRRRPAVRTRRWPGRTRHGDYTFGNTFRLLLRTCG